MDDGKVVKLLERIAKAEEYKAGSWSKVIEYARKYAMLESFGHYINDDGMRVMLCSSDKAMYLEHFKAAMCREAITALSESSMPIV